MSGISVCGRCGSEVRVSDDCGGNCPHCGAFVCAGTFDSIAYEREKEQKRKAEIEERMKHVVKVVVECWEADDERNFEWSKEFSNKEDALKYAHSQFCPCSIYYYDEKGLIQ